MCMEACIKRSSETLEEVSMFISLVWPDLKKL